MANIPNSEKTSYIIEVIESTGKTFGIPFEFITINDAKAVKEAESFTKNLSKVLESTLKVSIKVKGESEPFSMSTCKFVAPVKVIEEPIKDAKQILKKSIKVDK